MVLPKLAVVCPEEDDNGNGGVKSKCTRNNFSKKGVRRLSRKRRKARRKRERNIRERKNMSFDNGPYDHFWGNYFRCVKWAQNHHASYWKSRAQALEYENKMLRAVVEQSSPVQLPNFSVPLHSQNCRNNVDYRDNLRKSNIFTREITECDNECTKSEAVYNVIPGCSGIGDPRDNKCDSDSEEFEFEVDDNLIEFFTQSMKHKLELERERNENDKDNSNRNKVMQRTQRRKSDRDPGENFENDDDKSSNYAMMGLKKVLPTGCFEQNEVVEGKDFQEILQIKAEREEKDKEKRNLFGKSASKILGMETAVQLNFRQTCATKRPVVWPIIPFNL